MPRSISNVSDFDIQHAIAHLSVERRGEPFSTIDVIRKIIGVYLCDTNTSAAASPNALFGKRLSENAVTFGIKRVLPDVPAKDDAGNSTTTAIWQPV